jgi:protein O-GlcNAc transferase
MPPSASANLPSCVSTCFTAGNISPKFAMPNLSPSELLQKALALHRAGAVADAAVAYGEVLCIDPANADAHYYLGMISCQHGRFAEGAELARKSLAKEPGHAGAQVLLGRALNGLGRHDEALATFDRAIAMMPDLAPAHAHRADLLMDLGRNTEAIESYDRALSLAPDSANDWFNRGGALVAAGRYDESILSFDRAIAGKPDFTQARLARAKVLSDLGRRDEALEVVDSAISVEPNLADAWLGRGSVLIELRRLDDALIAFDRALVLTPNFPEAWIGRGNVLSRLKRYDESLAAYDTAVDLKPDLAEAWLGRGNLLVGLERYDEASAAYDKALVLKPELAAAWLGRAYILEQTKRCEEALAAYDKAIALKADLKYAAGARLFLKLFMCDWTNLEPEVAELLTTARERKPAIAPFTMLAIPSSTADQLQCAAQYVQDQPSFPPIWQGEVYHHDRIRVAYLSAGFHETAMAALLAGLFEKHDRSRFEMTAISFGPDRESRMRHRLMGAFEHFIDVQKNSDQELAELVRRLEIDVAVDLMGFTKNDRLGVFARRPAPIQVNYLGFPGTMGAKFIDYIIADSTVIPEDQCAYYSERVIWLPHSYLVNDDRRPIPERTPTRSECSLPESAFVFCCFNNTYKITAEFFDVWMNLLRKKENSVLWLIEENPAASANLRRAAERRGVSSQRLIFAPRTNPSDHLARQRLANLCLDTLPYNAHTTASDALWAGVPILTCIGTAFPGRVAASVLKAIGLEELITHNLQEYEALAFKLSQDAVSLVRIKEKIMRNRNTCALFDTERSARAIEAAYTMMWERYQRRETIRTPSGMIKPIHIAR